MTRYIALVRAANVGGTGKLPMSELKSMCADAGFARVETYIASGNVVFDSRLSPLKVKTELETRLRSYAGKSVSVAVRTASEMAAVLRANPFSKAEAKHTYATFLDEPPPRDALDHAVGRKDEEMRLGEREIFIHYPGGMGRSKLKIPATKTGTSRNMNTIAKLAEIAAKK
jgi:uncharacterized protein (DUF1697 family)